MTSTKSRSRMRLKFQVVNSKNRRNGNHGAQLGNRLQDPYQDLRFDEGKALSFPRPSSPEESNPLPTHTVMVKRKQIFAGRVPSRPPTSMLFQTAAAPLPPVRRREETLGVFNHQPSLLERKVESLQCRLNSTEDFWLAKTEKYLTAQERCLEAWDRDCRHSAQQREHLSNIIDVPPESVLFNRPLPFPFVHRKTPAGGFSQLLQDSKTAVCMVKPPLDGQQQFRDFNGHTVQTSSKEDALSLLYIRGEGVSEQEADSPAASDVDSEDWSGTGSVVLHSDKSNCGSYACSRRLLSPYYVRHTVPALQLHKYTYVWGQTCLQDIVEIAVVCREGEQARTSIRLANIGCSSIRYSWKHKPRGDPFNTKRFAFSPIIFDFSDGVLLPEEKVRLLVHFRPQYLGSWKERWLLITHPCLGPKDRGGIPVSLWAHTLDSEVKIAERERFEREMMRPVVRHDYFLSHPSPEREDTLTIPDISRTPDDVAAFLSCNPRLHYHSVSMVTLMRVYTQLHGSSDGTTTEELPEKANESEVPLTMKLARELSITEADGSSRQVLARRESRDTKTHERKLRGSMDNRKRSLRLASGMLESDGKIRCPTVDQFQLPRSHVDVCKLYREALNLKDEGLEKEEILNNINEAIIAMSRTSVSPVKRHYKHILVRAALKQLFDAISLAEWRLRSNLGLLSDPRYCSLTHFPQSRSQVIGRKQKRSLSRHERRTSSRRTSSQPTTQTTSRVDVFSQTTEDLASLALAYQQWQEKLRLVVYTNLSCTLLSLLPILECDGYWMNLLLPKPEL